MTHDRATPVDPAPHDPAPQPGGSVLQVVVADSPRLLDEHHRVRREVFIDEQGVTEDEEWDGRDEEPATLRAVGLLDGAVVAAGRLLDLAPPVAHADESEPGPWVVHVGRVAVLAPHRGRGLGRALMEGLHRLAVLQWRALSSEGDLLLVLDAQQYAQGFYESLGYARTTREPFLDARIPHVEMAMRVPRG